MNRVPRLLLDSLPAAGGEVRLEASASHHLLRVLRAAVGQELELLDGRGGRAAARLESADRQVRLSCQAPRQAAEPDLKLEAWLPLIRPERLEWAVEKLTELGIWRIVPYSSARSGNQKRPPDLARLGRIIDAALEQSGNPWRPGLAPPASLAALLDGELPLLAALPVADSRLGAALDRPHGTLALLAGPEGGFSAEEIELVMKRSLALVSLGPHVVRAETALVTLTGVVQALTNN
ncbi:MAG: RsmE family RNA methyltransferase [Candidatus Delongbacteria bacterium]